MKADESLNLRWHDTASPEIARLRAKVVSLLMNELSFVVDAGDTRKRLRVKTMWSSAGGGSFVKCGWAIWTPAPVVASRGWDEVRLPAESSSVWAAGCCARVKFEPLRTVAHIERSEEKIMLGEISTEHQRQIVELSFYIYTMYCNIQQPWNRDHCCWLC